MKRYLTLGAVLTALLASVVLGGIALADGGFAGMSVGSNYWLKTATHGYGSGQITQADAYSLAVIYGMSLINVYPTSEDALSSSNAIAQVWGVCIDTRQYSGSPQLVTLLQGWGGGLGTLGTSGRLNGTVLDENAWKRVTYLFSKHQSTFASMDNYHRAAFQLAVWEVLSGDGSYADGGLWSGVTGPGNNFVAANVSNGSVSVAYDDVLSFATGYVKDAFDPGLASWTSANSAYYFHDGQDFLVYVPPAVPDAPAHLLAGLGLVGVTLLRRKPAG